MINFLFSNIFLIPNSLQLNFILLNDQPSKPFDFRILYLFHFLYKSSQPRSPGKCNYVPSLSSCVINLHLGTLTSVFLQLSILNLSFVNYVDHIICYPFKEVRTHKLRNIKYYVRHFNFGLFRHNSILIERRCLLKIEFSNFLDKEIH